MLCYSYHILFPIFVANVLTCHMDTQTLTTSFYKLNETVLFCDFMGHDFPPIPRICRVVLI